LATGGPWEKFLFGPAGNRTAQLFRQSLDDWVQVSITDSYCAGDSFDLLINGTYLLTTPRVTVDTNCSIWVDGPEGAWWQPQWSSTKFSLKGPFEMTVVPRDSPFQGGAYFVRADKRATVCAENADLKMISPPIGPHSSLQDICSQVGGHPATVSPSNALMVSQMMKACGQEGVQQAWFGQVELAVSKTKDPLGCLALNVTSGDGLTVAIVDCATALPFLCQT